MNSQEKMIREMKNEDRRYGDDIRPAKSAFKHTKTVKNPKNLARYNLSELQDMEDEGDYGV